MNKKSSHYYTHFTPRLEFPLHKVKFPSNNLNVKYILYNILQMSKKERKHAHIIHAVYVDQCVRHLVVVGGDLCFYPAAPEKGRGQQAVCLCLSVSKPISPSWEERKEGVTWQNDSYYEIVGVHFNSKWPCQGHHMPACLPGLLETRCYWTKAAAPQRHTQQLFSVATYHLMTLMEGKATHDLNTSSLRGNNSHRPQQLNTSNNTDSYHKEREL